MQLALHAEKKPSDDHHHLYMNKTTGQSIETMQLALHAEKKPSDEHHHWYNLPQCCEVSILMPNEIPGDAKRQVLLEYKSWILKSD